MQRILLLIFCFAGYTAAAQDLSGIWRGHFKSNGSEARILQQYGEEDLYKFETQINQKDKAFTGVTYSYKTTVFYGKAACYGAFNPKTKKLLLEENKLIEVKSAFGGACLMTCFLQYSKVGKEEFLEGTYSSISTDDSSRCGKGTIFLRKVPSSDFYKEPFLVEKEKTKAPLTKVNPPVVKVPPASKKNPPESRVVPSLPKTDRPQKTGSTKPSSAKPPVAKTPAAPKKSATILPSDNLKPIPEDSLKKILGKPEQAVVLPRVLSTRKNELVRTISTSSKDVFIRIYDNGSIDNDTVSVYVDKKLVVSKQRLTEKAIVVKISLDENSDQHELIMVAENLGEIPPNTSLMVVTAGDQQYEVRITSTEQKNAVVLFKYEPK